MGFSPLNKTRLPGAARAFGRTYRGGWSTLPEKSARGRACSTTPQFGPDGCSVAVVRRGCAADCCAEHAADDGPRGSIIAAVAIAVAGAVDTAVIGNGAADHRAGNSARNSARRRIAAAVAIPVAGIAIISRIAVGGWIAVAERICVSVGRIAVGIAHRHDRADARVIAEAAVAEAAEAEMTVAIEMMVTVAKAVMAPIAST